MGFIINKTSLSAPGYFHLFRFVNKGEVQLVYDCVQFSEKKHCFRTSESDQRRGEKERGRDDVEGKKLI